MQGVSELTRTGPEASTILAVNQLPEDYLTLERIFQDDVSNRENASTWRLLKAGTLSDAIRILKRRPCPAVICERDLPRGSWKDLLDQIQRLDHPPSVIVSSRHADEYLWAEALNLGAYDVLSKPFDRHEIIRVISLACSRWRRDRSRAAARTFLRQAAEAV